MTHPLKTSIREVRLDEAAQIVSIMVDGAPGMSLWSIDSVRDEIGQSQSLALRDAGGSLAAFIFLRDAADAFEISYLATHVTARKKGLMRDLLTRATDLAVAAGRPIWLEVHEQNEPARKLYEALGFKQTGRRPKYYADAGAALLYNYG